jgi:hypothetical protein
MRKIAVIVLMLMLMIPYTINAEWMAYTTRTSSGLIINGAGYYHGVKVNTDGTNDATVTVYDNTTASGTVIDAATTYTGSSQSGSSSYNPPLQYKSGLYLSVATTGTATVTVYYTPSDLK